jgi:hypothetical protein
MRRLHAGAAHRPAGGNRRRSRFPGERRRGHRDSAPDRRDISRLDDRLRERVGVVGNDQPGLVEFAQENGALTVKVHADAQPDFNVGGQTRCLVHGDFNAQVDFNLVDWPARNGVWVSLMIGGTPYNVYRVSWQFEQNEAEGAYLPPAGTTLPATAMSGTLRLSRTRNIFTAYYVSGRDWTPIVSGTGPTDDVPVTLAVFNISGAASFAGQPVTVSFDNFHVFADRIVCP